VARFYDTSVVVCAAYIFDGGSALMPRVHSLKGQAFIEAIFTGTKIGRNGGPVRRAISSIKANASLANVYAAASRLGWRVEQVGGYWFFHDARLPSGEVVGISSGNVPTLKR